ncbi:23S rRNA (guanosine(2251)-2'-O)-methyltransferase RlmB [Paraperlucidibaca wandonensis]|jgi:23S rRNA (guanosine2251-2'-O)-methyltransferase|uniref:23S rRNA (guanosine-2'-O-)-methyltransferase RlmB n=1 Tax=Paraperlucidibaca wandonensis TaxID=1268273 RepID=A0ABW3HGR8_9GAMM
MSKMSWIYGLHTVQALLENEPERVLELQALSTREDARLNPIVQMARQLGLTVAFRDRSALDQLAEGGRHQGVVARVRERQPGDDNDLAELLDGLTEPALLLILDAVTDPHNLGACLRTAEAAGVHAVVAPRDKAAGLTPVVRKVACGAAELVPFMQVTNLARTLKQLKERGVWVVGTSLEDGAKPFFDTDLKAPVAIVMGAEGSGLRRLTAELCDHLAYIPMAGQIESLNVSVATGVALFEAVRQRRGK